MTNKIKFDQETVSKIQSILGDSYSVTARTLGGLAVHNLSNSLISITYDCESNEFYISSSSLSINIQLAEQFQEDLSNAIDKIKTLNEIIKQ